MMKFETLLRHSPEWMQQDGPHRDIVITSRVRLARNLKDVPFPGWAQKEPRAALLATLQPKVEALPQMKDAFSEEMAKLDQVRKQVLLEKHLISREQAAKGAGSAAVINRQQSISIMINEEDHLRMQSIRSGLDLRAAFDVLDAVDSELEQSVQYAFDKRFGYLTACPTNLGTGMRASAMLHLPGLVLGEQITQVIQAVNKIGLAVRGIYGEGSEALANLYQISNQHTLGTGELALIARLERVIEQVISHERNARKKLLEEQPVKIADQVGRGYAVLRYAHSLDSREALAHLSMLRRGTDLGLLPEAWGKILDTILVDIQPAHLQISNQRKLTPAERDILRSQTLRERLKDLPEPAAPGKKGRSI